MCGISVVQPCLMIGLASQAHVYGSSVELHRVTDDVLESTDPWDGWTPPANSTHPSAQLETTQPSAKRPYWTAVDLDAVRNRTKPVDFAWSPSPPATTAVAENLLSSLSKRAALGQQREEKRQPGKQNPGKGKLGKEKKKEKGKKKERRTPKEMTKTVRDPNYHPSHYQTKATYVGPDIPVDLRLDRWLRSYRNYTGHMMTVRQVFNSIDADKNGYLQKEEVNASGLRFVMDSDRIETDIRLLDVNGDGRVYFENGENIPPRVPGVLDKLAIMDQQQNIHDFILDELAQKPSHFGDARLETVVVGAMIIAAFFTFSVSSAKIAMSVSKDADEEIELLSQIAKQKLKSKKFAPPPASPLRRRGRGAKAKASPRPTPKQKQRPAESDHAEMRSPSDKGTMLLSMLGPMPELELNGESADPAVIAKVGIIDSAEWTAVESPKERGEKRAVRRRSKAAAKPYVGSTSAWQRSVPSHLGGKKAKSQVPQLNILSVDEARENAGRACILSPAKAFGGCDAPAAFADLPRTPSNGVLSEMEGETAWDLPLKTTENKSDPEPQTEDAESVPDAASHTGDARFVELEPSSSMVAEEKHLEEDVDLVTVETVIFMGKYYLVDTRTLEVYDFNDGVDEVINPEPIGHWNHESQCVLFLVPPQDFVEQMEKMQAQMQAQMQQMEALAVSSAPVSPPSSATNSASCSSLATSDSSSEDGSGDHLREETLTARAASDCTNALSTLVERSKVAANKNIKQMDVLAQKLQAEGRVRCSSGKTAAGPPASTL